MADVLLSIVIVNYNTKDLLGSCLASIDVYLKKISPEIIVVDNASTDGSVAFVRNDYPDVNLVCNTQNLGFAKANNIGIKLARGEFVLLLNSDTEFIDCSIQECLQDMQNNLRIAVMTPCLLNPDGSIQLFSCGYSPTLARVFNQFFLLVKLAPRFFNGINKYDLKKSEFVDWVAGTAMIIRKEVFSKVGSLNENFFMYVEDMEFCYRIRRADLLVYYKHNARIVHLGMGSSLGLGRRGTMKKEWLKNFLIFIDSCFSSFLSRLAVKGFIFLGVVFRYLINALLSLFSFRFSNFIELTENMRNSILVFIGK